MIINATKDPNVQPVTRGGTGKTTHTSNSVLTGQGTSNIGNVASANGALYATSANGAPKFGTLPVAQGGTGATTASGARSNLGVNVSNLGLSGAQVKTLLWTNASPTSAFANQTLSLGLSSYDAVEIEYCYGSSYTNAVETGLYKKSYTQQYMTCHGDIKTNNTGFYISQRLVTVTESGITFGKGIYKNVSGAVNGAEGNTYCVPLKIYGIKGV